MVVNVQAMLMLTLVVAASTEIININPSLMLQMNEGFLENLKTQVIKYINKNSVGVNYGDQKGKEGILYWELCDITLTSFNIATTGTTIQPNPPANLVLSFSNIDAKMTAGYTIYEDIIIKVSQSGSIDVTATMSLDIEVSMKATADGHADISIVSCKPDIKDFEIKFHGGMIDDLLDVFKGVISAILKPILNAFGCDLFEGPIEDYVDKLVYNMTEPIPIIDGFYFDTTLTQNPLANTYTLIIYSDGRIEVAGVNKANVPSPNHMMAGMSQVKDICIKVELPVLVNSFFYSGIVGNKLNISITQVVLNAIGAPHLLDCQCGDQQCIGEVIPGLQQYCPSGGQFGLQIEFTDLSQLPSITMNTSMMMGVFFNQAVVYAGNSNLLVLNVTTAGYMPESALYLKNNKIYGDITISHGSLTVVSSMIGSIQPAMLNALWNTVLAVIVDDIFDTLFKAGIPLPIFPNMPYDISTGIFQMNADSLQLCADMTIG